ncbi:MAG TPA: Ig-like domain-containing protein [bacterium]|nr:Ig-like domain-containing protein [bacterium]
MMRGFRRRHSFMSCGPLVGSPVAVGLLFIVLLALGLVPGCGDNGGTSQDKKAPTVIATAPADGATDVSPCPVVSVTFSEAMDPASIDTLAFHVDGVQAYSVAYDAAQHKATFFPKGFLEPATTYTAHVDTSVTDANSNAMEHAVAFHFTTGPLDCEHIRDRFEPNDSIAAATPVELATDYPCLTSCGGAERTDWYRFTVTQTKKIEVTTVAASPDTDRISWKINFRRADGKDYCTMGTSVHPGWSVPSFFYTFMPGTYWVETGKSYDDSHLVMYHLQMRTLDPAPDDEFEDNDFPDEAAPITAGLHEGLRGAYVDADYYSINLTAGQTMTVTATEITSTGTTRRLQITRADGGVYTSHTDTVNPSVESWTATETGTYLICVRFWTDNVIYNLNVEVGS